MIREEGWALGGSPASPGEAPQLPVGAHAIADLVPIGIALLTSTGRTLYLNPTGRRLLGCPAGLPAFGDLLPVTERAAAAGSAAAALTTGAHQHLTVELVAGQRCELAWTPARDASLADEQLLVVTIQDVTGRHLVERELEHRASHDALTGLRNRAWLLDLLHHRLVGTEATVIAFIDLDRFKAVNDELGHHMGDGLLAQIAASLQASLHPGEVAARVGGDEFVVVSSDLDDDALVDFDQRLRLAVSTVPIAREHGVGSSVGTARSVHGDEPWSLLRRADEAMYAHKRQTQRRRALRRTTPASPPG